MPDTCGAGRWRGGLGLRRSYRLLADEALLQLRTDRVLFAPYGLDGGEPGGVAGNWLVEGNASAPLPGKVTMTVRQRRLLTHEQAGGGGHGDPFARAPEAVARDVWNGKVTVERGPGALRRRSRRRRHGRCGGDRTIAVETERVACLADKISNARKQRFAEMSGAAGGRL